jgi:hypothetical protein
MDSLDPYLRECVQFFTRPCRVIKNRFQIFGNKSKFISSIPLTHDSRGEIPSITLQHNSSGGTPNPYYSPTRGSMIVSKEQQKDIISRFSQQQGLKISSSFYN